MTGCARMVEHAFRSTGKVIVAWGLNDMRSMHLFAGGGGVEITDGIMRLVMTELL